jgi:hypothetical protein
VCEFGRSARECVALRSTMLVVPSRVWPSGSILLASALFVHLGWEAPPSRLVTIDSKVPDIDKFLARFGIGDFTGTTPWHDLLVQFPDTILEFRLPELAVEYEYESGAVEVHRGPMSLQRTELRTGDTLFNRPPKITWDAREVPLGTVIMADLGPDGYGDSVSNLFYPFIHGMWSECIRGSLRYCARVQRRYKPPGNPDVDRPNRYVFILFSQKRFRSAVANSNAIVLDLPKPPEYLNKFLAFDYGWKHFDFGKLIADNPGLKAVSYNYVAVRSPQPPPAPNE